MTTTEIAAVVAGRVDGPGDTEVTGPAFVDSRETQPGGLFVAVRGERADGHDFAPAAVAAGAAAVLAERSVGLPGVVVGSCVEAIGVLAHHVLGTLGGGPGVELGPQGLADSAPGGSGRRALTVVGITGSQGKTSCKDLLAQLLEPVDETVAAVGSLNNEIGVPLTALRATETTRFLVVEMGARGAGHIRYLASMVRPQVGVVLNVGVAHLGEFGSRAAIARAKGELVASLPADGVAVLNADDDLVLAMRDLTGARVLTFGQDRAADLRLRGVHLDDSGHVRLGLSYEGAQQEVTLPLVGRHHAFNAAAAAAAALACGVPFGQVCSGLASVRARSHWRMEVATSGAGVTVVNDAYNANPDSMRAALETLADLGRRRGDASRTFAVLGEMRELGAAAADEHEAIGRLVARLDISRLVVVGDEARAIDSGASSAGSWGGESVFVPDQQSATDFVRRHVRAGDIVLVKASRAVGLETVALALLDDVTAVR